MAKHSPFELFQDLVDVLRRLEQWAGTEPSDPEKRGRAILKEWYPKIPKHPDAAYRARCYFQALVDANGGVETEEIFRMACARVYAERGWQVQGN